MKKGFTLVELVIVIIIVGILSIVAVPIYRGYTDRAKETEGKALLGSINTSEKVYYAEYEYFLAVDGPTSENARLSIDARGNKYFKSFDVTTTGVSEGSSFTAIAHPDTVGQSNLVPITLIGKGVGGTTILGGVSGESIGVE